MRSAARTARPGTSSRCSRRGRLSYDSGMGSSDGGISNDDTLAEDPQPQSRARRFSLSSYEVGATIGEGGMGEVLLARDPKIGRDVAIKRMRTATPTPELV